MHPTIVYSFSPRSSVVCLNQLVGLPTCCHDWRIAHFFRGLCHLLYHLCQPDIPHLWITCRSQLPTSTSPCLFQIGSFFCTFRPNKTRHLCTGMGYCLTFLPTVTILSQYFTRRRALVTAVASTGESLFMSALAPGECMMGLPSP